MPVALCTIGQAMKGDERGLWLEAIKEEYDALRVH